MTLGDLPAGQPYPDGAVQPAGTFRKGGEQRLAQEQAFPAWCYRPDPQFASLIPAVQHYPPPEGRPFLPIPFEHSDKLFA
jgi:hypothetical protein